MHYRKLVFLLSLFLIAPLAFLRAQEPQFLGEAFPSNERLAPQAPLPLPAPSALRTANTFVISISPGDASIGVQGNASIEVNFNAPINPISVNGSSFSVKGENSGNIGGTYTFSNGNATVTFTPNQAYSPGELLNVYVSDAIFDMNGDAVLPLASKFYADVTDSEGFFANAQIFNSGFFSFTVKPFDMNNDGLLDIVCMSKGNFTSNLQSKVIIIYNLGNGNFGPPNNIDLGYGSTGCGESFGMDVGDVNGDGFGDIVAPKTSNTCPGLLVLLNDGSGNFPTPVLYPTPTSPDQATLDDLNGDGALDVVVSGGGIAWLGTAQVSVFLNIGNGTFANGVQYPTDSHTFGVATADLDNDGDMDILAANSFGFNFSVLFNDGYGVFSAPTNYPLGFLPRDIVAADLNGDGLDDIVASNQTNSDPGTITIYYNQGAGVFGNREDLICNGNVVGLAVADVDGDGDLDIGTANYLFGYVLTSRSVSVFLNNNGSFLREDYDTYSSQPIDVNFGDFNGDGTADLISCAINSKITLLYNVLPNVVGHVFVDENEDCVRNAADGPIKNILIYAIDENETEFYTYTRVDGNYSFALPPNHTYNVGLAERQGIAATCPYGVGDHFVKTVTSGTVGTPGDEIPTPPSCGATLGSFVMLPPACSSPLCQHGQIRTPCPCEIFTYTLQINNTGNSAIPPGTVISVDLPSLVKLCSTTPVASTVGATLAYSGGTLNNSYDCADNNCNSPNIFGGTVNITLTAPILGGTAASITIQIATADVPRDCQPLEYNAYFSSWAGNANCIDNTIGNSFIDFLCCAYDPNDKKVFPSDQLCEPSDLEAPFYYTVRFQNTGTAPAYRVIVRDEIDSDLDMQSFRSLATSHTLTDLNILPGNTVEWVFDGINLPDSGSNMEGSMGHINYMIYAKENTPDGSLITNKAAIFFDANPPVITNTTTNQITGENSFPANFSYQQVFDCFRFNDPYRYDFRPDFVEPNATYTWTFGPDAPIPTVPYAYASTTFSGSGLKTATLTVTLGACSYSKTVQFVANGTVPVCHLAPVNGNGGGGSNGFPNFVTLHVPFNSLNAHLAHGDLCGPCFGFKQGESPAIEQSMQLSISPNPAQAFAKLDYATSAAGEIEIRVLDQLGREVRKVFSGYCDGQGSLEMNLEHMVDGVYFVELNDGKQRLSQKLVIVK